ncbi:unnamed protein product [Brachionus calyciflorus]|uniref:Integrase zinc-binding domain-containing protein n=1 Tax=Brachionus calyciflorus TaxID=104777 RepID=A0A814M591_9BILA|nr:unnamed protein product [Brachionus calyciflorus]
MLPGLGRNQVNRIKRNAKFSYDEKRDKVNFKPKNSSNYLEVPKPDKRLSINKKFHSIGHFASESTINRIIEKYWWKNLRKNVEKFVKQCKICLRNQPSKVLDHPAQYLKVTGIFDRIGIDLVLGLPETVDGYIGLFVIV